MKHVGILIGENGKRTPLILTNEQEEEIAEIRRKLFGYDELPIIYQNLPIW